MPEEPTNWQGLGRLAYFAVVSGSPAKEIGVDTSSGGKKPEVTKDPWVTTGCP